METTVQQVTLSCQSLSNEATAVSRDINVLALIKGEERYIFLYDEKNKAETLRILGRYASNPELSFTWYDAAVLSQKIRQNSQQKTYESQQEQYRKQQVPDDWN